MGADSHGVLRVVVEVCNCGSVLFGCQVVCVSVEVFCSFLWKLFVHFVLRV
jgi:hypothetical protein